jgi:hypothetical protein
LIAGRVSHHRLRLVSRNLCGTGSLARKDIAGQKKTERECEENTKDLPRNPHQAIKSGKLPHWKGDRLGRIHAPSIPRGITTVKAALKSS